MPEVADFARAVPELPIILNHIGALDRVGLYANREDEVQAAWRAGITAVAACPNITRKLGGMGMPRMGFNWHTRAVPIGRRNWPPTWRRGCSTVLTVRSGAVHVRSNFPPDKVSFPYNVMYKRSNGSPGFSPAERAAMFHDTAAKVYRIDVEPPRG